MFCCPVGYCLMGDGGGTLMSGLTLLASSHSSFPYQQLHASLSLCLQSLEKHQVMNWDPSPVTCGERNMLNFCRLSACKAYPCCMHITVAF